MSLSKFLNLLSRNKSFIAGSTIILAFGLVALAAPLLAPPGEYDPYLIPSSGIGSSPVPPNPGHPLGQMPGLYDVFYGIVWGTVIAFQVGVLITLGRALIGILIGLISGYSFGLLDAVLMRIVDSFMAFPIIAAALVTSALLGHGVLEGRVGGVDKTLAMTLVIFGWMPYARLVRGNVIAERKKEYVEAAKAIGAKARRILFRHLLPNITSKGVLVLASSDVGVMVVLVATFNFIGLEVHANQAVADWGQMLRISRNWILGVPGNPLLYWYTFLPAVVAIVLFSGGWSLIGDGLRDVLDPHLRTSTR